MLSFYLCIYATTAKFQSWTTKWFCFSYSKTLQYSLSAALIQSKNEGPPPIQRNGTPPPYTYVPPTLAGAMDHLNPNTTTREKTPSHQQILSHPAQAFPPSPTPPLELHIPTNRTNKSPLQSICAEIHHTARSPRSRQETPTPEANITGRGGKKRERKDTRTRRSQSRAAALTAMDGPRRAEVPIRRGK
ncbi:hypothetical protein PAHAL_4G213100 [Panicum hallii]|jgi:hypothetical protein|uniref:Uncharacterized protein n=1 Tax=Panicum hallii TaxID=206008 RepID=A0A2T8JDK4_9POAL|nr:hypothetical protein PAHAL_4G213100 [Panicum hallii]